TFRRVTVAEIGLFLIIGIFFSLMNVVALRHGVFHFDHPDLLGLPAWEFLMWGYYVIHLIRMVDGETPSRQSGRALCLAAVFAIPFLAIQDQRLLLLASTAAIGVAFVFFHQKLDFAYAGYLILVGALIEYTGVWSGQWAYPGDPPGGVPLWFVTLWGGVGLFTRRLVLPLLRPGEHAAA
ncbi:MAG: hypothetical protein ACREYB_10240, partial [Casimicrobiaceae bacterium]